MRKLCFNTNGPQIPPFPNRRGLTSNFYCHIYLVGSNTCGGLLCDENDIWIFGFSCKLVMCIPIVLKIGLVIKLKKLSFYSSLITPAAEPRLNRRRNKYIIYILFKF